MTLGATTLPGSPSSAASRGESARCRAAHADGLRHDEDATSSEDAAEVTRTSIIRAPSWQLQGAKIADSDILFRIFLRVVSPWL